MGKKIKIAKLAVFNIYGSEEITGLFDRVNDCENLMSHYIETDPRIDLSHLEKQISDLQKELKDVSDYDKSSPRRTVEVNSNKAVSELETRIKKIEKSQVNDEVKQLESRMEELERKTTRSENTSKITDKISEYESQILKYGKYIESLSRKVTEQEKAISSLENILQKQDEDIKYLREQLNKKSSASDESKKTPKSQPVRSEPVRNEPVKNKPEPRTFNFPVLSENKDKVYITEKISDSNLNNYFNVVTNISDVMNALEKSNIDDKSKSTYEKIMKSYQNSMITSLKKKKISELDDYELSEEITTTIGKVVQNNITGKIIPAVCDRLRKGYTEYADFFDAINNYLSSIGFYTEVIKAGDKITTGNNSVHMQTSFIKTTDRTKHGVIAEVDTLPYIINYIDEDENDSEFVCKGTCSAYRFE